MAVPFWYRFIFRIPRFNAKKRDGVRGFAKGRKLAKIREIQWIPELFGRFSWASDKDEVGRSNRLGPMSVNPAERLI